MKFPSTNFGKVPGRAVSLGAALVAMLAAGSASAQLPMPASTQFDYVGFIQAATLDATCQANAHCGGTVTVNGHLVTIPKETVVEFPANALTWQELFAQAPAPYGLAAAGGPSSGLAMADLPTPLTQYEIHVIGNRVLGGPGGADLQIAGLVFISQASLNSGAGFINFINYTTGEFRVGGVIGDSTTGARVQLNDPAGRYGRVTSPDIRFTSDPDNPTIISGTGYPMCIPRTDPAVSDDPLCPQAQRPIIAAGPPVQYSGTVNTNDPTNPGLVGVPPDAQKQVPFEVGDYITFAGTLVTDNASQPTAGPFPANGAAGTYISAHTIVSNIAVYTYPGTNPAYIMTDVTLIGTGGLTVLGAGEAVIRTRFEGMSTDPSRIVHLYGIDLDPLTGNGTDRDWGTIGVDPGAPTGAVKGRWRFRPPCTAAVATDKACTPPPGNTFLPPTRDMRAVIEGAWQPPVAPAVSPTAANGIIYGQFRAPIFEYIFPENIPGTAIVPNNFNTIAFLAQGGVTSSAGTLVGQLNPWPDTTIPVAGCQIPVANTGGPYTGPAGGTVPLNGTATGTAPLTFLWSVSSGSLDNPNIANPTFNAIGATSPITATLAVSNQCGSNTVSTTITLNAAGAPTVTHIPNISVFSGANGSFGVSATDPQNEVVTFAVTQSGAPALLNLAVTNNPNNSGTVTFTAPTLPLGQVTSTTVTVSVTATNTGGATSLPESMTVTINPLPDAVTVQTADYRTSKQRLDLTATSSVISPNVTLTLQPYVTTQGTVFDPSTLGAVFTNLGGGNYSLTLVGCPEPATPPATPISARSNLGGVSPQVGITVRL
ncbi:MAG TPA: hypothetical protein VFL36_03105 [Myxococcales bacterium]|nr:hypothetical protein [Myxococcales bacterium]